MKTGTLKTLGAAALGVAFAAAAAGTASAAPALPAPAQASALDSLTSQLPLAQATNLVPGAAQATGALQGALRNVPAALNGANGSGLLGGLSAAHGLPVGALGNGLPLGG